MGMERGGGEGGTSGRLWKVFGSEQVLSGMWEYYTLKSAGARKILADAAQEKTRRKARSVPTGVSPFKEVVEPVKRSADTDCGPQAMRRACIAMKHGNWESFEEECRKEGKLCQWTFERIPETYEKVAMDDIGRLGIAQEIQKTKHGLLAADHRASRRNGRSHPAVCLPALQLFPVG